MFECRNKKEPDCPGNYRSIYKDKNFARCDACGHIIVINELKHEQIDHDIKESKEKS